MDDLITFLTARLDEDEAAAKKNLAWMHFESKPGDWTRLMCDPVMGPFGGQTATRDVATGMYVGKMSDPARVLCEVEAKRKIVRRCMAGMDELDVYPNGLLTPRALLSRQTLMDLAAVYSDHPDYWLAAAGKGGEQ